MARKDLTERTILGEKVPTRISKSLSILGITASEDLTMFFTEKAITIKKVAAVLRGTTSPSVTFDLLFASDRSGTSTKVKTTGFVANSVTTGNITTTFDNSAIPANNWLMFSVKTAISGTVDEFHVTVIYTED